MGSCFTKKEPAQTEDQFVHSGNETEQCQSKSEKDSPTNVSEGTLHNTKMTFLDLPTEIIEKVFSYLAVTEVYCNLRSVCHRLRDIGDGYIQIGKHAKQNMSSKL